MKPVEETAGCSEIRHRTAKKDFATKRAGQRIQYIGYHRRFVGSAVCGPSGSAVAHPWATLWPGHTADDCSVLVSPCEAAAQAQNYFRAKQTSVR